jgi:RimJ/RimL family protein N-acetyltransferase
MLLTTPLSTPRLLLREFEEDDWRATHPYEANPEVVRYLPYEARTPEESQKYIHMVMGMARETPRLVYDFAVVLRDNHQLIGRCGMKVNDPELREAMLWYVLDPSQWGKGYIPEAARALLDFAFGTLGLHRVWADCDPRNPASFRVMEKLGMRREAHFIENAFYKGEWCDSLIYAMLDREWRARATAPGHAG